MADDVALSPGMASALQTRLDGVREVLRSSADETVLAEVLGDAELVGRFGDRTRMHRQAVQSIGDELDDLAHGVGAAESALTQADRQLSADVDSPPT